MSVIDDALRRAEEDSVSPLRVLPAGDSAKSSPQPMPVRNTDVPQAWSVSSRRNRSGVNAALCSVALLVLVTLAAGGGWGNHDGSLDRSMADSQVADSSAGGDAATSLNDADPSLRAPVGEAAAYGDSSAEGQSADSHPTGYPPSPAMRSQPLANRVAETAPRPKPRVDYARRFTLGGVMLGGDIDLAVINGTIVESGQRIDGAVVITIGRRSATLEVGGQRFQIPLSVAPR